MARNNPKRLYLVTLLAASRRVGDTRLTRGQSLTLPITADVSKFKAAPRAWDVKVVNGVDSKRRAPEPEPGTVGGSPVTPRAQAAFTGLVNRIDVSAKRVDDLDPTSREGFQAMARSASPHLGRLLFSIFGGPPTLWEALIRDPDTVVRDLAGELRGSLDSSAELRADLTASDASLAAAMKRIQELEDELTRTDTLYGDSADRVAELEDQLDRQPENRGADADAEDPAAELEAGDTPEDPPAVEPPAVELPPSADDDQPPAPPEAVGLLEALATFQDALGRFQAGDDSTTMAEIKGLAVGAGFELPEALIKTRRRSELGDGLAELLAAQLEGTEPPVADPPADPPPPSNPSPSELEG